MIVSRVFMLIVSLLCLLSIDKSSDAAYNFTLSIRNGTVVHRSPWSNVGNLTLEWQNTSFSMLTRNATNLLRARYIDCFGLGSSFASALHWFFVGSCKQCDHLDVRFFLSSRQQPQRVEVMVGNQFGLEWTDFKIERRTVLIVHGFLSRSNETWIRSMEEAFLIWGDVNVVVVDWSAGGNTWNYYKAVLYTRIVGQQITRFLRQIVNATLDSGNTDTNTWGPLHLVGHSLGAHICGFVCHNLKLVETRWVIKRVTGLDPAQPCFNTKDLSMRLDRTDAEYVDVIHTNGRLLSRLGLGLPRPIGHTDFYPNGGMRQPGCAIMDSSFFDFLPFSKGKIQETICSHGRSYLYLTESLISAANHNCSFWARHWDMTYRGILKILRQPCSADNCTEMGIRAEAYPHRGVFYVSTAERPPFCLDDTVFENNALVNLAEDLSEEMFD